MIHTVESLSHFGIASRNLIGFCINTPCDVEPIYKDVVEKIGTHIRIDGCLWEIKGVESFLIPGAVVRKGNPITLVVALYQ